MILYMYIAPGQRQTTLWGQTFDVNRKPLSLCPFVAGLKQNALKSDFIYFFFMFHHMYIALDRATEILKSKSVRSTDDVIGTCVRQSQIVTKTNDSSFSSKSVSEIDYFSNTL